MNPAGAGVVAVSAPPGQWWRVAVAALIMTGVAAVLAVTQPYGGLGLGVGVAGLAFFAPLSLLLVIRAVRRAPALVLGPAGFTDHSTAAAAGFVAWADVDRIDERVFMGRGVVCVTMLDPVAFRRGQPLGRRLLHGINGHLVPGDVLIPASVLPMSTTDLIREMRVRQQGADGHPGEPGQPPAA